MNTEINFYTKQARQLFLLAHQNETGKVSKKAMNTAWGIFQQDLQRQADSFLLDTQFTLMAAADSDSIAVFELLDNEKQIKLIVSQEYGSESDYFLELEPLPHFLEAFKNLSGNTLIIKAGKTEVHRSILTLMNDKYYADIILSGFSGLPSTWTITIKKTS